MTNSKSSPLLKWYVRLNVQSRLIHVAHPQAFPQLQVSVCDFEIRRGVIRARRHVLRVGHRPNSRHASTTDLVGAVDPLTAGMGAVVGHGAAGLTTTRAHRGARTDMGKEIMATGVDMGTTGAQG